MSYSSLMKAKKFWDMPESETMEEDMAGEESYKPYGETKTDEPGLFLVGDGQNCDPIRILAFTTLIQRSAQLLNRARSGDTHAKTEIVMLCSKADAGDENAQMAVKILSRCAKMKDISSAGMGYDEMEVAGFWGDLWGGIKSVAGAIPGVGNTIQKGMDGVEKAADLISKVNGGNSQAANTVKNIVQNAQQGQPVAQRAVQTLNAVNNINKTGNPIPSGAVKQLASAFAKPVQTTVAQAKDTVPGVYHTPPSGKEGFHRILMPDGRVVDVSGEGPVWLPGKGIGKEVAGWFFNKPYRSSAEAQGNTLRDAYITGKDILIANTQQKRIPISQLFKK